MAAILVPGVTHRQLPGKSRTLLQPRWITVHTMVWNLNSCEEYFAGAGRPYSHFGTGGDGEIRQWQDLAYRAASCLEGNPYSISIENADKGRPFPTWTGSDVPAFTDAQADALIVLISWLCHRFNLPRERIATSCPHERGIGWHRIGVDPWRRPNCLRWSSSRGKVCPGDRRIHQLIHEIIPSVSAPEADMADLTTENLKQIADAVWNRQLVYRGAGLDAPASLAIGDIFHHARLAAAAKPGAAADVDEAAIAREILTHLDPSAIAAAIPDDLAEQVADVLAERLRA